MSVSGGTLSDFTQVDGNSYTAIFTADDAVETTGSVSVAADYSDVAGNNGGAGSDTVTIDTLTSLLHYGNYYVLSHTVLTRKTRLYREGDS